jgi:WD40 repeat protein
MVRYMSLSLVLVLALAAPGFSGEDPELLTMKGPAAAAVGVGFFPDGKKLLSCHDGTLCTWDVTTGKQTAVLAKGKGRLNSARVSPDGTVAAAFQSGKVFLWDAAGKERTLVENRGQPPTALAFSPDGKRVAVGDNSGGLKVYDVEGGKEVYECVGHGEAIDDASLAFSPDGKLLVSSSEDRSMRVWDAETGKRKFTVTDLGWVGNVRFTTDGKQIIFLDSYSGGPYFQKCMDLTTAKVCSAEAPTNGRGPAGMNLVLNGKVALAVARGSNGTVTAWELGTTKPVRLQEGISAHRFRVLPSRDAVLSVHKFQLCAYQLSREKDPVKVKRLRVVQEHTAEITGLAVSADGKVAATADKKGVIKLWNVKKMTGE